MERQTAQEIVLNKALENILKLENPDQEHFIDEYAKAYEDYRKSIPEGGKDELYRASSEEFFCEQERLTQIWLEEKLRDATTGSIRGGVKIFLKGEDLILNGETVTKLLTMTPIIFEDGRGQDAVERLVTNTGRQIFFEKVIISNPKLNVINGEPIKVQLNPTFTKAYNAYMNSRNLITPPEKLMASKALMKVDVQDVTPDDMSTCDYVEEVTNHVFEMLENNILVITRKSNRRAKARLELLSKAKRQMEKEAFLETKMMACEILGKKRGEDAFKHAYELISIFISFEGIVLDNQCEFKASIAGVQDTSYGIYFSGNGCETITPREELIEATEWANMPEVTDVPDDMTIKDSVSELGAQLLSMMEINIFVTDLEEINEPAARIKFFGKKAVTMNPDKFNQIKEMTAKYFGEESGLNKFKSIFDMVSGVVKSKYKISTKFDERNLEYTAIRDQFGVSAFAKWVTGTDDAQLPHYPIPTADQSDGQQKPKERQPIVTVEKLPEQGVPTTSESSCEDEDDGYFDDLMRILANRT